MWESIFGVSLESPEWLLLGFLSQNFGSWRGPTNGISCMQVKCIQGYLCIQVEWWGYHESVGTLKLDLTQKNLFERFALTGSRDTKTSSHTWAQALAHEPLSGISTA